MDEITYINSKWTVPIIIPFSDKEQTLVFGMEEGPSFPRFVYSAADQATSYPYISSSLVIIVCLVVFECHLSFASFFN